MARSSRATGRRCWLSTRVVTPCRRSARAVRDCDNSVRRCRPEERRHERRRLRPRGLRDERRIRVGLRLPAGRTSRPGLDPGIDAAARGVGHGHRFADPVRSEWTRAGGRRTGRRPDPDVCGRSVTASLRSPKTITSSAGGPFGFDVDQAGHRLFSRRRPRHVQRRHLLRRVALRHAERERRRRCPQVRRRHAGWRPSGGRAPTPTMPAVARSGRSPSAEAACSALPVRRRFSATAHPLDMAGAEGRFLYVLADGLRGVIGYWVAGDGSLRPWACRPSARPVWAPTKRRPGACPWAFSPSRGHAPRTSVPAGHPLLEPASASGPRMGARGRPSGRRRGSRNVPDCTRGLLPGRAAIATPGGCAAL